MFLAHVGRAAEGKVGVQRLGQPLGVAGPQREIQLCRARAHTARIGDGQHRRRVAAHLHHLIMGDAQVLAFGRCSHDTVARQVRQSPCGAFGQTFGVVVHLAEQKVDLPFFLSGKAGACIQKIVDVVAVALGAGHAPGAGVGLLQKAQLCQRGHFVAQRGAGHRMSELFGQQTAANRLSVRAVQCYDRPQHTPFPIVHRHRPHHLSSLAV